VPRSQVGGAKVWFWTTKKIQKILTKAAPWQRRSAEEKKIAEAQTTIPLPKIQIIILCVHLQL